MWALASWPGDALTEGGEAGGWKPHCRKWISAPCFVVVVGSPFYICFGLLLGDCARHGKDELRVLAGCGDDALICLFRDSCADRVRVRYVTEAPEGFDLLGWETGDLFHIDEGIEGFNAIGRGGVCCLCGF